MKPLMNHTITTLNSKPCLPLSNDTIHGEIHSQFKNRKYIPSPSKPDQIKPDTSLDNCELPLLREIAHQLQEHSDDDPLTALRKARELLESAFQSVQNIKHNS